MNRWLTIALAVIAMSSAATARQNPPNGTELLFKLEAQFAHDVAQHGHDAFLTWFADDGVEVEDGDGIATQEDRRKQSAWPEGTTLTWTPVHGDMAASGDLGYTYGNYVYKYKDKTGKMVTRYGKYTTIWKKQKDGSWKVVLDMGNSSPAPKTPQ